ncbi:MAG: hypothetical protein HQK96_07060 [Nitrospirae bacterium]|nr:hypothetical protein [Nitrospirota bacterium]
MKRSSITFLSFLVLLLLFKSVFIANAGVDNQTSAWIDNATYGAVNKLYEKEEPTPRFLFTKGSLFTNICGTQRGGLNPIITGDYTAGYPLSHICDNLPSLWFYQGLPAKLDFDFRTPQDVQGYVLQFRADTLTVEQPTDWVFSGSNDNLTWIALDNQTGQSWTVGESKTFGLNSGVRGMYRYYRLNITGATDLGPSLSKIQILVATYGKAVSDSNKSEAEKQIEKLTGIPYLAGYDPAPYDRGVLIYNEKKAFNGYNLFISGHEPAVYLMDMKGVRLHEWYMPYEALKRPKNELTLFKGKDPTWWRNFYVYKNGDLLTNFEAFGMFKINKDSKLLWYLPNKSHHEVKVSKDGKIYALTSQELGDVTLKDPKCTSRKSITLLDDFLSIYNSDGELLKNISITSSFKNSPYYNIVLDQIKSRVAMKALEDCRTDGFPDIYEIYHTNTIYPIEEDGKKLPAIFKKGRVLLSSNILKIIFVIDIETEKVVWVLSGMWGSLHSPMILKNGNILVFNNHAIGQDIPDNVAQLVFGRDFMKAPYSNVLEVDPITQKIVWYYDGAPDNEFFTFCCSLVNELGNGNILITIASGQAIELKHDDSKKVVWKFINETVLGDNTTVAGIAQLTRVPKGYLKFLKAE